MGISWWESIDEERAVEGGRGGCVTGEETISRPYAMDCAACYPVCMHLRRGASEVSSTTAAHVSWGEAWLVVLPHCVTSALQPR